MSRYIDADKLKGKITEIDGGSAIDGTGFDIYTCEVFELIDEVPTADVVEVVRCKDCKFWETDWGTSYDGYHYCLMIDVVIAGDFYCKDGERKILPKD